MKIKLGKKLGYEKEAEVKTFDEILNYLINERHREYVYVRYYDDNGNEVNEYTVRCWYNDDCTIRQEDGTECYDWKKSQEKNAKTIYNYLIEDGIICT